MFYMVHPSGLTDIALAIQMCCPPDKAASFVMILALAWGWYSYNGDISYGRLNRLYSLSSYKNSS